MPDTIEVHIHAEVEIVDFLSILLVIFNWYIRAELNTELIGGIQCWGRKTLIIK